MERPSDEPRIEAVTARRMCAAACCSGGRIGVAPCSGRVANVVPWGVCEVHGREPDPLHPQVSRETGAVSVQLVCEEAHRTRESCGVCKGGRAVEGRGLLGLDKLVGVRLQVPAQARKAQVQQVDVGV